jgi:hypothetical protein
MIGGGPCEDETGKRKRMVVDSVKKLGKSEVRGHDEEKWPTGPTRG